MTMGSAFHPQIVQNLKLQLQQFAQQANVSTNAMAIVKEHVRIQLQSAHWLAEKVAFVLKGSLEMQMEDAFQQANVQKSQLLPHNHVKPTKFGQTASKAAALACSSPTEELLAHRFLFNSVNLDASALQGTEKTTTTNASQKRNVQDTQNQLWQLL
jgi:hypothetical protein